MDHSTHTPLPPEEINSSNLKGADIYGPDDHEIGNISHLHGTEPNAQAVIDVGGFLGIGTKTVALEVSRLKFMRDENGNVHGTTTMTKDELKNLPEHRD